VYNNCRIAEGELSLQKGLMTTQRYPQEGSKAWQSEPPNWSVVSLVIYVASHCPTCAYAHEVADLIRQLFPQVALRLVDIEHPGGEIPEIVFATPTYLLNGRIWSLGNPSLRQVCDTLSRMTQ
jgi:2-methylcitrate dehydratase PrpD